MSDDLPMMIQRVAVAREAANALQRTFRQLEEAFRQQHASLLYDLAEAKVELADLESALRAATIEVFEATGHKQPADGVGVRVIKTFFYPEDTALEWAIDHRIGLKLDERAFERVVMSLDAAQRPSWVRVCEKPQATIARDLAIVEAEVAP